MRVSYQVDDATCARVASTNVLSKVLPDATCTHVTVTATLLLGSTTHEHSTSVPIVYVSSATVSFARYPSPVSLPGNRLGLVECFTDTYHRAIPKLIVTLTDDTSSEVTTHSSFVSAATSVVSVTSSPDDSTLLAGLSEGSAEVEGSFGSNTRPTSSDSGQLCH